MAFTRAANESLKQKYGQQSCYSSSWWGMTGVREVFTHSYRPPGRPQEEEKRRIHQRRRRGKKPLPFTQISEAQFLCLLTIDFMWKRFPRLGRREVKGRGYGLRKHMSSQKLFHPNSRDWAYWASFPPQNPNKEPPSPEVTWAYLHALKPEQVEPMLLTILCSIKTLHKNSLLSLRFYI